jgi:GT2 family glycosyltransferase
LTAPETGCSAPEAPSSGTTAIASTPRWSRPKCLACAARRVSEELRGFDEDFFASHEDVDLSYRARLLGYRCRYVPGAVVRHRGSATMGAVSAFAVFHGQRNLEWMFVKNTPGALMLRTLPAHLLYTAAAGLHFARMGRLGPFLRGKVAAAVGLGPVLRKRAEVQRTRRVGAAAIAPLLERRWLALKRREKHFDSGLAESRR